MLSLDTLYFSYSKEHQVLKGISLELKPGEVFGIVGSSGGGKSTFLKIVAGLLDATKGSVSWNGTQVKGPSQKLVPGHEEIQLVNQNFSLDLFHTVKENVLLKILHLPEKARLQFCYELLDLVELTHIEDQQARFISGGEQQRLAIARALAMESEVLLLDEPFSHLDAHLRLKIGAYIKQLIEIRNTLCILVSHEGAEVMQWCSKIGFLDKGKLTRVDSPHEFYFNPTSFNEGAYFGELNEVKEGKTKILFRPCEYKAVEKGGIEVEFMDAVFFGAYWKSFFRTNNGETLVLYANKSLKKIKRIGLKKKSTKA
ncbi:ABC transporter ATP-binding protein [Fluviicola taffensis]|uniref:Fe(3+)-transporting ATPase n=1 Tax=Fluviicola taffensis (strain DSM 16823 / NCIMB 13979 / RW262) TaxID=755732 RepID=F2IDY9_FLUTR|nr:ATP-binding cassette domain-containing protein [Fluviicola taffensis]AEA45553.1 Fe(3+)-transporting ATPase [Fluviicola taffensis DSM 16823]